MTSIEPNSIGSALGNLVNREVQLCHYLRFQALLDQGGKKLRKLLLIDVSEMGVVELSGLTHSQELLDRIIEVVNKVPGVSKVYSEIVIGTSLYAGDLNRPRS